MSKKREYIITYCSSVIEDGLKEVDLEMAITRCADEYGEDICVYEVIPVEFEVQSRVVISPRT